MCGIAGYFLKPDAQPLAGGLEQMQAHPQLVSFRAQG